MLPKFAKVIISICLSLVSVFLYNKYKTNRRKRVMIAMLICTIADLFMVNLFGIGDFSTYIGAVIFMVGHMIYGLTYVNELKNKYLNKGFKLGLLLVILSAILLAILTFVIYKQNEVIMFILIMIYFLAVGFNLVSHFSVSYIEKKYLLALGMILFLFSDYLIFMNMLNLIPAYNDLVWATYIPAQLLIIVCCDN